MQENNFENSEVKVEMPQHAVEVPAASASGVNAKASASASFTSHAAASQTAQPAKKIEWHKVTWYSRLGGILVLFIIIPILSFLLAIQYKDTQQVIKETEKIEQQAAEQPVIEPHISYTFIKYQSGISMPTVVAFPDEAVMNRVNRELTNIGTSLGCQEVFSGTQATYFNVDPKVVYNKNDIFSVSIHASYFCGGAYPTNDSNLSVTFDMKTGERVDFEELFQNYEQDKAKILRLIFGDLIRMGETYKGKDQNCNTIYSEKRFTEETIGYGYVVSKEGITVQPLWPHVIEVCAVPRTVMHATLAPYLKQDSLLSRVK